MRRSRALPNRRARAKSSHFPGSGASTTDARGQPDRGRLYSQADLVQVQVDLPGIGIVRPWRFVSDTVEIRNSVLTIC
jgi:hypothetical protein